MEVTSRGTLPRLRPASLSCGCRHHRREIFDDRSATLHEPRTQFCHIRPPGGRKSCHPDDAVHADRTMDVERLDDEFDERVSIIDSLDTLGQANDFVHALILLLRQFANHPVELRLRCRCNAWGSTQLPDSVDTALASRSRIYFCAAQNSVGAFEFHGEQDQDTADQHVPGAGSIRYKRG
jgi:hypothetical protein